MAAERPDPQEFWDARAAAWDRHIDGIETLTGQYGEAVMDRLAIQQGERVIDVGCGPGTTVIELARRVGPTGVVAGTDISPNMVEVASSRARAEGVANAVFAAADAQTADLVALTGGEPFDAVFSRFGVMFFPDPDAAFANLARALRPGGRLGVAVWRGMEENPWVVVPTMVAVQALGAAMPIPGPDEPGPFSLADPTKTEALLTRAGFDAVAIEPLSIARVWDDPRAGSRAQLEIGGVREAFTAASPEAQEKVLDAVVEALGPFRRDDGAYEVPAAGWAVTAVRA